MFRITKIFEHSSLTIYKVEGKIADENLLAWAEELWGMLKQADRQLILDLSQVWSMNLKAIDMLMPHLARGMKVMNPGVEVRNMLHAAGLSSKVLE